MNVQRIPQIARPLVDPLIEFFRLSLSLPAHVVIQDGLMTSMVSREPDSFQR